MIKILRRILQILLIICISSMIVGIVTMVSGNHNVYTPVGVVSREIYLQNFDMSLIAKGASLYLISEAAAFFISACLFIVTELLAESKGGKSNEV